MTPLVLAGSAISTMRGALFVWNMADIEFLEKKLEESEARVDRLTEHQIKE